MRDADGECRDTDTPLVERAHHDVEAAIERSQQRICAKPDLIEMQRSHRRGALAHFLFFLAARHTILVEIDDEDGHAAIAEGGIGARQHVGEIGNGRIVNPHLGAGKPEARSVALSRRPDTGNVGAGLGFGNAIGNPLAGAECVSQIQSALPLIAMHRQKRADQFDEPALIGDRGIAARQFLHHQGIGKRIEPGAAIVIRHRDAEQAELRHFTIDVGGKGFAFIELARARAYPTLGKASRRLADLHINIRRMLRNRDHDSLRTRRRIVSRLKARR